jgi:hypothetical protein
MNSTYTITEGNDALNRVLLMMRYDSTKTLSEQKKFTDQDIKKLKNDEFENNTRKYVDKTAVSFRGPDGKKISTATFPKMTKKIDSKTFSEWLLEVREFFFTPEGATLQVVLSIAGAEIGAPILFMILDGAIIINDAYMMVRDWDNNGPKMPEYPVTMIPNPSITGLYSKQLWEWFKFHFTTNIGFQNLIVDIGAILLGQGIFKLGKATLKSASKMFKLLIEKFGPNFMKKFVSFLEKFKPKTDGLPKELGSWVDKKYSEITKAIELWKTPSKAVKTVVNPLRLSLAGVSGAGTYKLVKWFESKSDAIAKFFESNPEKDSALVSSDLENFTDKDLLNTILDENPKLFKSAFKPKTFKIIMVKKNNKMYPQYYIIDGVKYSPVDLTKGLEVKMIK